MKKPVLVCDIDDVVFPFIPEVAKHYNQQHQAALTPEDFVSFNLYEVWGGTQQEANTIIESFLGEPQLAVKPIEGAIEAFARLKQDFDIVMVTARNGIFEGTTSTWLKEHFADLFSHVVFAGNPHDGRGYRTKGEICQELGAVLIIDDHPANVMSAVQQGTDGILFGDRTWTIEAESHEKVMHCQNWPAVEEYIYGTWRYKQLS